MIETPIHPKGSEPIAMPPPLRSAPTTPQIPPCPFCASTHVITIGKSLDVDKYWRCRGCGEIWNEGRLQFVSTPRGRRR
jgi:hypothetical protein